MEYEVIVVGAGLGGLTAAALLASRGVNVCLVEKGPHPGGCAITFPRSDYQFEVGPSLYAAWQPGEIHDRIFSELKVEPPEVRLAVPAYSVRLPDKSVLTVTGDDDSFFSQIERVFPECSNEAVSFYRQIRPISAALQRVNARLPDLRTAGRFRRTMAFAPEFKVAPWVLHGKDKTVAHYLSNTSERFRRFIDVQLQLFSQRSSAECAFLFGAVALMLPRTGMHLIRGGASSLANRLTDAIRTGGGTLRFDSTVRRALIENGQAAGIELMTGEQIRCSRALVSNLTCWDTYGRLVGHEKTPEGIRRKLRQVRGWGAYVAYLSTDAHLAERLESGRILALAGWQQDSGFQPEENMFIFSAAPSWDPRAPEGKRAVTVSAFTEASKWFEFQTDAEQSEERDNRYLQMLWESIHEMIPELDDSVEVLETANPQNFYDQTRRRLGMVGGIGQSLDVFGMNSFSHRTPFKNLFMVGDTVFPGQGVAGVSQSALIVANELAPRPISKAK